MDRNRPAGHTVRRDRPDATHDHPCLGTPASTGRPVQAAVHRGGTPAAAPGPSVRTQVRHLREHLRDDPAQSHRRRDAVHSHRPGHRITGTSQPATAPAVPELRVPQSSRPEGSGRRLADLRRGAARHGSARPATDWTGPGRQAPEDTLAVSPDRTPARRHWSGTGRARSRAGDVDGHPRAPGGRRSMAPRPEAAPPAVVPAATGRSGDRHRRPTLRSGSESIGMVLRRVEAPRSIDHRVLLLGYGP